jgi:hypothetical protein
MYGGAEKKEIINIFIYYLTQYNNYIKYKKKVEKESMY